MLLERTGPDAWLARQRPGAARWFGLPFVLVSLLPFAGAFGLLKLENDHGGEASPWVLVPFGLVFLAIGLGVILFRRTLTIDLESGVIRRRAGVLWFARTASRRVTDFGAVAYSRRVIRSDKSTRVVYPVTFESGDGRPLEFAPLASEREARRAAEDLAKTCKLAVVDRTGGSGRRREFDELDLSLRERRALRDRVVDPGPPPSGMRSRMSVLGDSVEIDIPKHGLTPLHIVGLVFATGPVWLAAGFVFVAMRSANAPWAFKAFAIGMGVVPMLIAQVVILFHAMRRYRVVASGDELRVEERGMRRRTTVMPADTIEDLYVPDPRKHRSIARFVGGGPPIVAVSDDVDVRFGRMLKHAESEYLVAVLHGVLSAPESSSSR